MSKTQSEVSGFHDLALHQDVLKGLDEVGYESPSPIQAQVIPHIMSGKDVVGQAQTGTGKTAAFALPLLSRIDLGLFEPQVLVLTPTRELAIQVAEAFKRYGSHLPDFRVMPVYGGQDIRGQLRQLQRGVHVVVGTPGRVIDHLKRKSLTLDMLHYFVLDEADEMLRMGFIDDVEWILQHAPEQRQIALFSATMPAPIRKIAQKYLSDPVQITIEAKTTTVESTRQRYWIVSGYHKIEALTRILEGEIMDGVIVFVRTKTATVSLAEKLEARGYRTAALNGDIQQNRRERTIQQLKSGELDILVATDVAARGLDVDRISHVINYDIPYDTEAYVHRIGRTGRAGRSGKAILFVAPREQQMLRAIERATGQKIELMELPSTQAINDKRVERFLQKITETLAGDDVQFYRQMLEKYAQSSDISIIDVAAALAKIVQGETLLLLSALPDRKMRKAAMRSGTEKHAPKHQRRSSEMEEGMERYRVEVGHRHGVTPGNIVGAIANEAGIDSEFIGRIDIQHDFSYVDLPEGMPRSLQKIVGRAWVAGQQLRLSRAGGSKKMRKRDEKQKLTTASKSRMSGHSKNVAKRKASSKRRHKGNPNRP